MIKVIEPGSWEWNDTAMQLIKYASHGMGHSDLRTFIKRAGTKMADDLQKLSFAPGEVPIHLIAIGANEYYGPNRNGDAFSEETCRKYHNTFVKHARWYRNHQNKDPQKSYGIIKYSTYNEAMHRIELIVALNGTKEAAKRNGGLVADKELEKLAAGKDIAVSMACKVAYDVCSVCGNKAKTRNDYCRGIKEGGTCPGGGCSNNMCKAAEDGKMPFVLNPHPGFFDMSDVLKGADRIAHVLGPMQKAASTNIISGAELAEIIGLTIPYDFAIQNVSNHKIREQVKLAYKLSEIENNFITGGIKEPGIKLAGCPDTQTKVTGLDEIGNDPKKRAYALKALAHEKIALSLTDFVQLVSGKDRNQAEITANKVQPYVTNIFSNLCEDTEKLAKDLAANPFILSEVEPTYEWKYWAQKQASNASLDPQAIQRRAWLQSIRDESVSVNIKTASDNNEACEGLARLYGLYKLAFLYEIQSIDKNFDLTASLSVRQNQLS